MENVVSYAARKEFVYTACTLARNWWKGRQVHLRFVITKVSPTYMRLFGAAAVYEYILMSWGIPH